MTSRATKQLLASHPASPFLFVLPQFHTRKYQDTGTGVVREFRRKPNSSIFVMSVCPLVRQSVCRQQQSKCSFKFSEVKFPKRLWFWSTLHYIWATQLPTLALNPGILTFWRPIFFFQISAHPVFKMWVIQKPNKVALWNKRHFEEKKWRLYSMFKIFSTDTCWINIKWGI